MVAASALRIACCGCPAARGVRQRDRGWWRRPRRGWHAAAAEQQGVCGSVTEAGGGVRAADGNLPLLNRRFMTPEVGRSWRY
ncbi:hypothetical protein PF005_g31086 [Phytophthora fragariae]|uniref:Uncharacterized protein n=1 Tax=Phytophthora fragariae TaxID=53985 RepID=A0A6A3VAL7_9STRA|nr:hypothetical protein PF005_g31086 [Phytophthora fragariae]